MVEESRIRFHIRITPKSSKNEIMGWTQDASGNLFLKISVTSVPEKGKANQALITLLAKQWKIPKTQIMIEKGDTDRNKVLSIPQEYKFHLMI